MDRRNIQYRVHYCVHLHSWHFTHWFVADWQPLSCVSEFDSEACLSRSTCFRYVINIPMKSNVLFPCSCIGKYKGYAFHGGWLNFQNRSFIVSSCHKVFQIYQICSFYFLFDRCFFRFPILRVSYFEFHGGGTHRPETVAVYKYNILYETYKSSIQPQFQWHCDPNMTVFTFGNAGKSTSS